MVNMSELDEIWVTHFRNSERSYSSVRLSEFEPFVRALADWKGHSDTAWGAFRNAAHRLAQEQKGEAFLPSVIIEGLSTYVITGTSEETPRLLGEGYSKCQRALRRLNIARLENFETRRFNEVLEAFKQRLGEHGFGCYGIGTDDELLMVLVIKSPSEFERIAGVAGIELNNSWDW